MYLLQKETVEEEKDNKKTWDTWKTKSKMQTYVQLY